MPAMAGLSFCSRCTDRYLRAALLALLLTPAASSAATPDRAATPDLAATMADATSRLRLAWAADSSSTSLPFPSVRLLPAGASVEEACNPPSSRPPAGSHGPVLRLERPGAAQSGSVGRCLRQSAGGQGGRDRELLDRHGLGGTPPARRRWRHGKTG
ncbi:MAG: hypothetical protein VKI42_03545 [Synechococcaceae cyanobacterium]|nr:hypothetical protein [Synechococcaceae cyanobacterium]